MRIYIKMIRDLGKGGDDAGWNPYGPTLECFASYGAARAACDAELEDEAPENITIYQDTLGTSQGHCVLWQADIIDCDDRQHYSEVTLSAYEVYAGRQQRLDCYAHILALDT